MPAVAPNHAARRTLLGATLALVALGAPLGASDLESRTLLAYQQYVAEARQAFLKRVEREGTESSDRTLPIAFVENGDTQARGRLIKVSGGLVHHWTAAVVIKGVTLDRVLRVAQSYGEYASVHKPVVSARVVSRTGDTFQLAMRMKEDAGPISGVLDVWSTVTYTYVAGGAYSFSETTDLRQVKNAGQPDECYHPRERGPFVWRANTFTWFMERRDGVRIELETLALTRTFPTLLRWVLEPIARRLGRTSVERTLNEFRAAVLNRAV